MLHVILLTVAALLGACLWMKHRQGVRRRLSEKQWTGIPFDVSAVAPRLRRLRRDYVTEFRSRPHPVSLRRGLLASARQALERLSYFRDRRAVSSASANHDTETHTA